MNVQPSLFPASEDGISGVEQQLVGTFKHSIFHILGFYVPLYVISFCPRFMKLSWEAGSFIRYVSSGTPGTFAYEQIPSSEILLKKSFGEGEGKIVLHNN